MAQKPTFKWARASASFGRGALLPRRCCPVPWAARYDAISKPTLDKLGLSGCVASSAFLVCCACRMTNRKLQASNVFPRTLGPYTEPPRCCVCTKINPICRKCIMWKSCMQSCIINKQGSIGSTTLLFILFSLRMPSQLRRTHGHSATNAQGGRCQLLMNANNASHLIPRIP